MHNFSVHIQAQYHIEDIRRESRRRNSPRTLFSDAQINQVQRDHAKQPVTNSRKLAE